MKDIIQNLDLPARAMGVPVSELATIVERGRTVAYDAGACLFHESTPREWLGIVVDGEVEIVRGLHGRQTHLATLTDGALISEGILLDKCALQRGRKPEGFERHVMKLLWLASRRAPTGLRTHRNGRVIPQRSLNRAASDRVGRLPESSGPCLRYERRAG